MISAALRLLVLVLALFLAGQARAQTAAAPSSAASTAAAPKVDRAALDHLIQTLQDPKARDQLLSDLKALEAAQQPTPPPAPLPTALGAKLLRAMSDAFGRLRAGIEELRAGLVDPAHIWAWVRFEAADPGRRAMLFEFLWQLALILAVGFAADLLARRFVARAQDRLRPARPPLPLRRLGRLLLHGLLEVGPILAFAAAAYLVVAAVQPGVAVRLALLAIVSAVVIARAAFVLCRLLLSPFAPTLRLVPIDDETAAYLYVWARRLVSVGVYGYFALQVALLLGLPQAAYELLLRLLGLFLALLAAAVILQNREPVARLIARPAADGRTVRLRSLTRLRAQLARAWHVLALIYLAAIYLTGASGVPGGFAYLGRGTGLTILILLLTWVALALLRRAYDRFLVVNRELLVRYPLLEQRANRYLPVFRAALGALIRIVAAIAILDAWQVDVRAVFENPTAQEVIARLATVLLMLAVALVIWEVVDGAVTFYLERRDAEGRPILLSSRARTLLPLVRNALFVVICLLTALTVLSELGVNIAPLLAGAGVVGLAVGFGAQTLVKDVITGAFILFEDPLNIGDVATINGTSGLVEGMTIRTVKLRDGDGTLHTIPFGAVGTVSNMARDYGYYSVDVAVAYQEDTDRVIAAMRQAFDELSREPAWRIDILGPIEIQGIDRFTLDAVHIRARIKTRALRQWDVGREYNRRMKMTFDALGIQLFLPARAAYVPPAEKPAPAEIKQETPARRSGSG